MSRGVAGGYKIGLLASETPPVKANGHRGFAPKVKVLLPALREQSGTWFRVGEFESPTAARNLRKRLDVAVWAVEYEFESRPAESGGSILYGRHVGRRRVGRQETPK